MVIMHIKYTQTVRYLCCDTACTRKPLDDAAEVHSESSRYRRHRHQHTVHANLHDDHFFACTNSLRYESVSSSCTARVSSCVEEYNIVKWEKKAKLFMVEFAINLLHFMLGTFHISVLSIFLCGRNAFFFCPLDIRSAPPMQLKARTRSKAGK